MVWAREGRELVAQALGGGAVARVRQHLRHRVADARPATATSCPASHAATAIGSSGWRCPGPPMNVKSARTHADSSLGG